MARDLKTSWLGNDVHLNSTACLSYHYILRFIPEFLINVFYSLAKLTVTVILSGSQLLASILCSSILFSERKWRNFRLGRQMVQQIK